MTKKKKIEPLVLKIEGSRITTAKFMRIVKNFTAILRNVADELTEGQDSVTWLISAEKGSQVFKASPEADETVVRNLESIPKTIYEGFGLIERGRRRPRGFSDAALKNANELASVIGNGDGDISRVAIRYVGQTKDLSVKTSLHVKDILGVKRTEDGSVEGRVTVLSDKRRFKVYVDDVLTGHSVRCTARDVDEDELIATFRKRIAVTGTVHYRRDNTPVRIEVDNIRILGRGDKLPSFDDVKGIFRQGN
ncbi:MAG: hypothetical protein KKG33_01055 [candidate division Zixibacteria bacterium]|nr:hypothetical protein [candidate division Zixibacteria bacterium]MBU1470651.1 hypothetical protein [candidate division Zixibacteria bacterium]MBU2624128.1 hypothetical protein [candidate division Zixibacteria bacterium]